MTEARTRMDSALNALARHINEQRAGDENAPICVHVIEAYEYIDQLLLTASALDRIQRAIDALERIEAEIEADSADASDKEPPTS